MENMMENGQAFVAVCRTLCCFYPMEEDEIVLTDVPLTTVVPPAPLTLIKPEETQVWDASDSPESPESTVCCNLETDPQDTWCDWCWGDWCDECTVEMEKEVREEYQCYICRQYKKVSVVRVIERDATGDDEPQERYFCDECKEDHDDNYMEHLDAIFFRSIHDIESEEDSESESEEEEEEDSESESEEDSESESEEEEEEDSEKDIVVVKNQYNPDYPDIVVVKNQYNPNIMGITKIDMTKKSVGEKKMETLRNYYPARNPEVYTVENFKYIVHRRLADPFCPYGIGNIPKYYTNSRRSSMIGYVPYNLQRIGEFADSCGIRIPNYVKVEGRRGYYDGSKVVHIPIQRFVDELALHGITI